MAQIVLITGGSRSGKSGYAQKLAESMAGSRIYIATCTPLDEEMAARIARHQAQRHAACWQTLEEPLALSDALKSTSNIQVRLVDCLTLWVNNLLFEAERKELSLTEEEMARHTGEMLTICKKLDGIVFFVTNEVGMGVVPDNALSRLFRDIAGRCNQIMAAGADRVVFMVSGLPVYIKGEPWPVAMT